ncbi:hypothetical protein Pla86_26620 [Planctomycetes bacterium Pla86]|uniref:Uncharacterized protein n=2 Tax=Engelhardtia mirabilis TaxID=2528011 RepID=A0A518BKS3_9BACT|nr:hypothetical protein Pla133_26630 [Planctomycetes bacterium Pla133]QDV01901.1 hypothetical protein Pla86_26620 [Planctomycetes bacterium Pla86]
MAKKGTRKRRRSPEEIIKDLQTEIERVKARAAAKELKESAAHRAALSAVRTLDKAMETAKVEGETALAHALADSRAPLAEYLEGQGVALPKSRRPRGRRPKAS